MDEPTDSGQSEPAYSSEQTGLQEAARDLSARREQRAANDAADAATRPKPRERTPEEDEARDYFHKRAMDAHEDELAKDGRKLNPRSAGEALAKLREYETRLEQDAVAATPPPEAQQAPQQQDGQAREPTPVDIEQHPKVREAIAQAEQVRSQMLGTAVQFFQLMRSEALAEFPDINTDADLRNLASTDPARFAKFTASAQKLFAAKHHIETDIARHKEVERTQFQTFAADQDARFIERHPELNDRAAFKAAHEGTVDALRSLGFSDQELVQGFTTNPLLRDHRTQAMLYQIGRYHAAMRAARSPQPRPIPSVQRPQAASAHDGHERTEYQALRERHGSEVTVKQATAELIARRAARARR